MIAQSSKVANLLLSLASLVIVLLLLEVGIRALYFQTKSEHSFGVSHLTSWARFQLDRKKGIAVNRKAWEATYLERGLEIPTQGPREGYWASRTLPNNSDSPYLRFRSRQIGLEGLVDVDSWGLQHAGVSDTASTHLLLVGGSVAWGAMASSIETTYFEKLAELLSQAGHSVRVTVLATGGWVSYDELTALNAIGLDLGPDLVIFLNGMNDLTEERDPGIEGLDVVTAYLRNMDMARMISTRSGTGCVFVPQPFLVQKKSPTDVERRIVQMTSLMEVESEYSRLRQGLEELSDGDPRSHFVDCSGAADAETATTFADQWHLSDPGQRLLAECLARGLEPILATRQAYLGQTVTSPN